MTLKPTRAIVTRVKAGPVVAEVAFQGAEAPLTVLGALARRSCACARGRTRSRYAGLPRRRPLRSVLQGRWCADVALGLTEWLRRCRVREQRQRVSAMLTWGVSDVLVVASQRETPSLGRIEPRELSQSGRVAPGHPGRRCFGNSLVMALQRDEVTEDVDLGELSGVDDAHKQIADASAVDGLVEESGLAMQDGLLQDAFTQVVVEWRARDAQEERERIPVIGHVLDGVTEAAIGLDLALLELLFEPPLEIVEQRLAMRLVKAQPLVSTELLLLGGSVVA